MKLHIELTEDQLQLIINALEVNFRMMQPQCGGIVADMLMKSPDANRYPNGYDDPMWNIAFNRYLEARDSATYVLNSVQKIMFGDYQNSKKDTDDYHRISDIWSALRHAQYKMKPTDSWDVRSREPFQISDYPMIKVEVLESE